MMSPSSCYCEPKLQRAVQQKQSTSQGDERNRYYRISAPAYEDWHAIGIALLAMKFGGLGFAGPLH
jgi:hypothetical protein